MPKLLDLSALRFGMLVVRASLGSRGSQRYWQCLCDCGGLREVTTGQLNSGRVRNCGCRHGRVPRGSSELHNIYRLMLRRCYDPTDPGYARYGGRGITVCKRWRQSYYHFVEDVFPRPSRQHSLDRLDNDGPYSPKNTRWATRVEQQDSRGRKVTAEQVAEIRRMGPSEAARKFGITRSHACRIRAGNRLSHL